MQTTPTNKMKTCTIHEHYDPGAIITAESDPSTEFAIWEQFAAGDPDWVGDEFTLLDFEDYINGLKNGRLS